MRKEAKTPLGFLGGFFVVLRPTHLEMSSLSVKGFNYDPCSPLITILFVPCLLWDRRSFILVIFENPWHSYLLPSEKQWSCHTCFNNLGLSRPGIEPRSPACYANTRLGEHSITEPPQRWHHLKDWGWRRKTWGKLIG